MEGIYIFHIFWEEKVSEALIKSPSRNPGLGRIKWGKLSAQFSESELNQLHSLTLSSLVRNFTPVYAKSASYRW